ncbi:AGC protein kinase, variant 3 [Aphanomyces astaci]|uniref:AGC protein kinase, variant 3 n=2 Tax=Aphanomyces astaci TaxID=112090 RepID=W4FKB9_APHAT|nr:AGC protein kinase, variant 3 [Aphanomyces astaci]ETV67311.1 AGC protein kinase, variant 3 [Aphanomyces astaci]|eukprot:XP_009843135.1 AGC protein kinase, variant 3 [Aphanomyces astaci]
MTTSLTSRRPPLRPHPSIPPSALYAPGGHGGAPSSSMMELELIRTILGDEVPTSVLLSCLHAASNDVSTAVNLYFSQQPTTDVPVDLTKSIRSSMPVTLHPFDEPGMLSNLNLAATLTTGAVDAINAANERFKVLRFRKRGNPLGAADMLLRNGDIVSLECNGLWLCARKNNALQWKPVSDTDDRNKFVMRGLALGTVLTVGEPFFLTSYRWKEREIAIRRTQSIGLTLNLPWNKPSSTSELASPNSNNTLNHVHRCFLGLARSTEGDWRLYFRAAPTPKAAASMATAAAMSVAPLNIRVEAPIKRRVSRLSRVAEDDEGTSSPTDMRRIEQMQMVLGLATCSKETLVEYLDGAGGNVQIALEHYFMTTHTDRKRSRPDSTLLLPMPRQSMPPPPPPPPSLPSPTLASSLQQHMTAAAAVGRSPPKASVQIPPPPPTSMLQKPLTIEDFEMLNVLGRGSFGAVMMVRYKQDGRIFAIKILKKSAMDATDMQNAMEERQILQRVKHPYVSSLVFAFQTSERLYLGKCPCFVSLSLSSSPRYLGMKFYAAGDLFYHLNQKGGGLPLADARLYAAELVLAISYLHSLNILYRDLKPSNIMIDEQGHIGIVDFGLSKQHIQGTSHGVKTLSGTAEYVAPEALVQTADGTRDYGKAYDWWSFGIVLYEMIVGVSPFYHDNERTMLQRIVHADVRFPADFPKDAKSLVRGLLNRDPKARLSGDAIQSHPFFASIQWTKLYQRQVPAYWTPDLSSETDTKYVDPVFTKDGPPSAVYDVAASHGKKDWSKRFSQFSFDFHRDDNSSKK